MPESTKIQTDFKVKSEEAGEEMQRRLQAVFEETGAWRAYMRARVAC
jgi:hypothetical protein